MLRETIAPGWCRAFGRKTIWGSQQNLINDEQLPCSAKSSLSNFLATPALPYLFSNKEEKQAHADENRSDVIGRGKNKLQEPGSLVEIGRHSVPGHQGGSEYQEQQAGQGGQYHPRSPLHWAAAFGTELTSPSGGTIALPGLICLLLRPSCGEGVRVILGERVHASEIEFRGFRHPGIAPPFSCSAAGLDSRSFLRVKGKGSAALAAFHPLRNTLHSRRVA